MPRKSLALLLTAALLLQQGLCITEAFAQTVAAQQSGGATLGFTIAPVGVSVSAPGDWGLRNPVNPGSALLPLPTLLSPLPTKSERLNHAPAAHSRPLPSRTRATRIIDATALGQQSYGGDAASAPMLVGDPKPSAGDRRKPFRDLSRIARGLPGQGARWLAHGFDGSKETPKTAAETELDASQPAGLAMLNPGTIKVFLTRAEKDPVAANLKSLQKILDSDPRYVQDLNAGGRVRLVVNEDAPDGGLVPKDINRIRSILKDYGIKAKIEIEKIPIDWARKKIKAGNDLKKNEGIDPGPARRQQSWWWRYLAGPATAPLRELAYLTKTLLTSLTMPTWNEILGGVVSKTPGVILGLAYWAKILLPVSPVAFGAALALTLGLNIFHGIFINSWSNFQDNIGRQRGIGYQATFNLFYVLLTGGLFRIIAWSAIPGTVPPWSLTFLRDMGVVNVFGTFFGTLGFQGLNGLYNKGRIPRMGRSLLQQLRELFFTLSGTFLGAGSTPIYWSLFIFQQSLDIGIYHFSQRAKTRNILYLADRDIAATSEFQSMYPVKPGEQLSPLKQALKAMLDNPILRPAVAFVKWLIRQLAKTKKNAKSIGAQA